MALNNDRYTYRVTWVEDDQEYNSGKFMVRIPPDVHRNLAIQAAESGISLNRLASAKLSQC